VAQTTADSFTELRGTAALDARLTVVEIQSHEVKQAVTALSEMVPDLNSKVANAVAEQGQKIDRLQSSFDRMSQVVAGINLKLAAGERKADLTPRQKLFHNRQANIDAVLARYTIQEPREAKDLHGAR